MAYDYVVVGSGSAGSVVAARLGEDAGTRVLVLEAGGPDSSIMRRIPAALDYALRDDRYNWRYLTDPEPGMDGRRMDCPRGRVIGGSSSINGMMFIRGHPLDFDGWAGNALPQWSFAHCLPYFRKLESHERGGDGWRGRDGPLHVAAARLNNPLDRAFLQAALQAGYPYSEDNNGFQHEGFGRADGNIHRGRRWSVADAWLRPALRRGQVEVVTRALALKVIFDGRRAVAVEYRHRGEVRRAEATREVILAGGAINSPQLLLLSGVGCPRHLAEHDIATVAEVPGVGRNLQDHLDLKVQVRCKRPVSLWPASRGLGRLAAGAMWLLARHGPAASNLFHVAGYLRSRPDVAWPNLQLTFMALATSYDGSDIWPGHGYQVHLDTMRPTSRGRIRLKSADPAQPPSILFNYLQTENDRREVIDGLRLTREILAQEALRPYDGGELAPGKDAQSDADILAWARARGETEYHPVGSCRMGTGDDAVVDGELKVHGAEGLRVVDASIMPAIVAANTQCTTIMIAEKAADAIRARQPLAPDHRPFYRDAAS